MQMNDAHNSLQILLLTFCLAANLVYHFTKILKLVILEENKAVVFRCAPPPTMPSLQSPDLPGHRLGGGATGKIITDTKSKIIFLLQHDDVQF